jgi:hypothetical protein
VVGDVVLTSDAAHLHRSVALTTGMPHDVCKPDNENGLRELKLLASQPNTTVWISHDPEDWVENRPDGRQIVLNSDRPRWGGEPATRRRLATHGTARTSVSATQAGFSAPAWITYFAVTTAPAGPSVISVNVTVARSSEPTRTGAGKRTLFRP